jgi:hypothetical protein
MLLLLENDRCVKELVDLLLYSKVTPTCFGKWLPSSGGRRCLISYSISDCIVGVYGLRSVQCGQLWNVTFHDKWLRSEIATHHVTRHNTPIHNILSNAPQFSISQKALGTLSEDDNVMPKQVGATIHN